MYNVQCTVPPLGLSMKASYLAETGLTTEPWLVSKLRWSVRNYIKYEKAKKPTFEPNMALTGRSLKIIFFKQFIIMHGLLALLKFLIQLINNSFRVLNSSSLSTRLLQQEHTAWLTMPLQLVNKSKQLNSCIRLIMLMTRELTRWRL